MKKAISVFLILVICLSITLTVYAENAMQDAMDNVQQEQEDLRNQLTEANEELEFLQNELSDNLLQVRRLDIKIAESQSELQELEQRIKELRESIEEIEERLKTETEAYEAQRKIFEDRLVAIYEAGETHFLDIILNSRGITEFLSSFFVVSEIAQSDSDMLNNIGRRRRDIEIAKERLDNEREQLAALALNQTRTSRVLQNTKTLRENFIKQLSEQEQQIQADIDEYHRLFAIVNAQILALAQNTIDTVYVGGVLAWPVPGFTRITSHFGMRTHPVTGVFALHTGVDIAAPMGANFVAANDGLVVKAEFNAAYGNMVIIDHGGGVSTLYAHGSEILVEVGQRVTRLDSVLRVGSTGFSTGPHAHFEVRINGVPVDPLPFITTGLVPGSNEN